MASQWSGLAPAVNAHLARWKKSDSEWAKVQRLIARQVKDGNDEIRLPLTAEQHPLAYMWLVFARTWGLPTTDGRVVTPEAIPVEGMTVNGKEQFASTAASEKNGMALMQREHKLLDHAETVYVSGEIVDRITYAAAQMDPEPLHATDLFAPSGLIVLEKPIRMPDFHPSNGTMTDFIHVGIRAIGWVPEMIHCVDPDDYDPQDFIDGAAKSHSAERKPGTMIYIYTTNDDWRATYARDIDKAIRDGVLTIEEVSGQAGEDFPDDYNFSENSVYTMGALSGRDHLVPSDVMAWAFGRPWGNREVIEYTPGTVDSSVSFMRRWFLTLMRFSWQKLITADRPPPSKKLMGRMADARRPNAAFSVLRLRRTTHPTIETGTGKRLMYRVRTRGHWKNVYVPSLGPARNEDGTYNPDSHRRQWIEAFWRGPLDGPLGPEHKATVIVR